MMRIQLQLFLTACNVNFLLTYVQSQNRVVYQAVPSKVNDDNGFRENLQNVFNSVTKNDIKNNEVYHDILQQKVVREQQAFDEMKEELQIAHSRNAYKKRNFYKRMSIGDNVIGQKRETNENTESQLKKPKRETAASSPTHLEYEEKFAELYGTNNETSGCWEPVRKTWPNRLPLYNYTHLIHEAAKLQPVGRLRMVLLQKRMLMFKFAQYSNMSIDVLIYGIEGHYKYGTIPYWYFVTKGLRPDCVFYLSDEDDTYQDWFSLYDHVCGIEEFIAVPSNKSLTTKKPYIWPWQTSTFQQRGPNEYF